MIPSVSNTAIRHAFVHQMHGRGYPRLQAMVLIGERDEGRHQCKTTSHILFSEFTYMDSRNRMPGWPQEGGSP